MWTPHTRSLHDRDDLRYPSDLTDAEWTLLAPFLPPPSKTGHRAWAMRELINAIFFVLRGGVPWRMLPEHFPPHQTAYRWFLRFRDDGTWKNINHHLVMLDRERAGREAGPTAAVIDTQSVKTTEAGGSRGYDAGKKIKGRKRHALAFLAKNLIKLHWSCLDSGRASCRSPPADHVRLVLRTGAYWLTLGRRNAVPLSQPLATAAIITSRIRPIKIAARLVEAASRVRTAIAVAHPEAALLASLARPRQPPAPMDMGRNGVGTSAGACYVLRSSSRLRLRPASKTDQHSRVGDGLSTRYGRNCARQKASVHASLKTDHTNNHLSLLFLGTRDG